MKKWREIGSKLLFMAVVIILIIIVIITAVTLGTTEGLRGKIITILACVPLSAIIIMWMKQK